MPRPAPTRFLRDVGDVDLLVLGDLNPDLILTGEEVVPAFGQIERLLDAAELTIGGSGAIVACGAAALGLRTAIVGVVGDDVFGRFMLDRLSERGVDVGAVVVDPAVRTGLTVILSRPEDRAILTFPGAISALKPDNVPLALLRGARHVHAAAFFLQRELAPGLGDLLSEAKRAGASTSLDPNWDPEERWDGGLDDVLRSTDLFLPNAEEVVRITGQDDAQAAALTLSAQGPLVALKLGAEGALAADGEAVTRVSPPSTIEAFDTTGAGDSFDAGMIAGLLAGWDTPRALALGCACGALSTLAIGGTGAQPSFEQAVELLGFDVSAPASTRGGRGSQPEAGQVG